MKQYWSGDGRYQETQDKLWALIPEMGEVRHKGRKLEQYRRAVGVYRDLYVNGLFNRFGEVRTILGVTPLHFGIRPTTLDLFREDFLEAVEAAMDNVILDAATEQGLRVVELSAHENMRLRALPGFGKHAAKVEKVPAR